MYFSSEYDQIWIWSHLLKKFSLENFIFFSNAFWAQQVF